MNWCPQQQSRNDYQQAMLNHNELLAVFRPASLRYAPRKEHNDGQRTYNVRVTTVAVEKH
jgi:hypothetical protein